MWYLKIGFTNFIQILVKDSFKNRSIFYEKYQKLTTTTTTTLKSRKWKKYNKNKKNQTKTPGLCVYSDDFFLNNFGWFLL